MSARSSLIYAPDQVRELDRIATQMGVPGYELMNRAGRAVLDVALSRFAQAHRWLILCGAGNNAGDGYVVARLAAQAGIQVTVAALSDPGRLQGDAAQAWQDFERCGGEVTSFTEPLCSSTDLVIDAMLGTGLVRPLEGAWLNAVESVNSSRAPVIAVDIPTGIDGTSGSVLGAAIRAAITVTFIGRKLGLYLGAGPEHAGQIMFDSLRLPLESMAHVTPRLRRFDSQDHQQSLPRRDRIAHKGMYGHVLVLGGNHGMPGAVALAGEAALRAGAGLVSVATRPEHVSAVISRRPELMCRGTQAAGELDALLERATVIAVGPGLGNDRWARDLLAKALSAGRRLVLDADALNLLAERPSRRDSWVLTPHPGEAARLLDKPTSEIQMDRLAAVTELSERFGGVALLKGRCTLVGQRGELPFVIDAGNPGMASAGMGDVLTGLVAGLLAQQGSSELLTPAACAAFIHAKSADDAAASGERGLIASDLFTRLRPWLNPVR